MSRLQVGGLALYTPTGDTVFLEEYIGADSDNNDKQWFDVWHIKSDKFMVANDTNDLIMEGRCSAMYLMPLGDKQTQDELAKELENDATISNTL